MQKKQKMQCVFVVPRVLAEKLNYRFWLNGYKTNAIMGAIDRYILKKCFECSLDGRFLCQKLSPNHKSSHENGSFVLYLINVSFLYIYFFFNLSIFIINPNLTCMVQIIRLVYNLSGIITFSKMLFIENRSKIIQGCSW